MNAAARFYPCEPLFWEDAPQEGRCYVYCFQEKDFFVFEAVEYEIWKEVIKGGRTLKNILDVIREGYEVEDADIMGDVHCFLGGLMKRGIVAVFE